MQAFSRSLVGLLFMGVEGRGGEQNPFSDLLRGARQFHTLCLKGIGRVVLKWSGLWVPYTQRSKNSHILEGSL